MRYVYIYIYIYELFIAFVCFVYVVYCVGKWQSRGSTGMFGNLMAIYYIMLQFIQNHSRFFMLKKTCMISLKASTFNAFESLCEICIFVVTITQIYRTIFHQISNHVYVFVFDPPSLVYLPNTSSNTLYSWAVFQTQVYGTQTYMNIPYKHVKECYSCSK